MVYVVQAQSNKNLLPAEKFGQLKYLLPEGANITYSGGQLANQLMVRLSKFSDEDYLLLVGDPAAIGIATAVASHHNQGKFKFLKWDRQEQRYLAVETCLFQKGELDGPELG